MKRLLLTLSFVLLSTSLFAQSTIQKTMTWIKNPETNVLGYKIYLLEQGQSIAAVSTNNGSANTNFSFTAKVGTLYKMSVTAFNDAGLESAPSQELRSQAFIISANGNPVNLVLGDFKTTNFLYMTVNESTTNGPVSGTPPNVTYSPRIPVVRDMISYKLPERVNDTNVVNYYSFHPVSILPPADFRRRQ